MAALSAALCVACVLTGSAAAVATTDDLVPTAALAGCPIPADRDITVTRKVYEVGQRRNASAKVMLAAFEAGWVESHMNNLPCGDRDSLGVFQERPSQGWGTPEQIMNVDYSAEQFFDRAQRLEPSMGGSTAGQLAQAVEKSGHPERYDQVAGHAATMRDEAFQPYGTIGAKYAAMGGPGGVLGAPIRAEESAQLGGRFQQFQTGIILWHPDVAFAIYGEIKKKFWAAGAEPVWGFPIEDEAATSVAPNGDQGRFQHFQNGLFLWSPKTGAHIVYGEIFKKFWTTNSERNWGFPVEDEGDTGVTPTGDHGRFQKFQEALFLWSPATGTHTVRGKILDKFWTSGNERVWGLPTEDEGAAGTAPNGDKGQFQHFQQGLYLSSPQAGTHIVHGEILKKFQEAGNERALGYPVTDETAEDGGRMQKFQNVTIHWNATKGTWITNN